ncbi:hypothetical protein [Bifidobacterium pseudocatenulatum]|uniref:hypothetical protein n=1 Tax=Bifidobacterium pseudocatenulatum TaxID=28026 RepID=UPI0022DEB9DF|nr:hypothetical protein [Bifidobacterium pseudocatenulatum]
MTTTLITGKGGTPHITSGDMGAMQAGIIGNGSYLLQGSDGTFPTVTMQDANHALIPVLNLVVEGRYARVTEAETATIESGVSGRNRNDLVCLKYTRNGQNIETAAIAVLKGTPNTGTAADPTVPSGSIHSASGTVWIPIARIPISGITPGTPVMLIKQLPPMSKLWDSVTLTFGNSNVSGGPYPIGRVSNPNAIKSLNGRATLSSGTTVAIPFIHPSYLQRSVQVSIAPDGTVNLLVGPEVVVTGGIVEIHF